MPSKKVETKCDAYELIADMLDILDEVATSAVELVCIGQCQQLIREARAVHELMDHGGEEDANNDTNETDTHCTH